MNTDFSGQGLWLLAGNGQSGDQIVDLGCSTAGEDALTIAMSTKVKPHHIVPQGVLQRGKRAQVRPRRSISMANQHCWCGPWLCPEVATQPWAIRCAKGERTKT